MSYTSEKKKLYIQTKEKETELKDRKQKVKLLEQEILGLKQELDQLRIKDIHLDIQEEGYGYYMPHENIGYVPGFDRLIVCVTGSSIQQRYDKDYETTTGKMELDTDKLELEHIYHEDDEDKIPIEIEKLALDDQALVDYARENAEIGTDDVVETNTARIEYGDWDDPAWSYTPCELIVHLYIESKRAELIMKEVNKEVEQNQVKSVMKEINKEKESKEEETDVKKEIEELEEEELEEETEEQV